MEKVIGGLDRELIQRLTTTLGIGTCGAIAFHFAGMPAAGLAGSVTFVAIAAVSRIKVEMPMVLRDVAFVVLGAIIGSSMDSETFANIRQWPVSAAGLMIGLVLLLTVVPYYLQRLHGIDRHTARMCSIPGALGYVVVLAIELGVDSRRVAILHVIRLCVLLTFIPALFAVAYDVEETAHALRGSSLDALISIGLVAACFGVAYIARRIPRFPAPNFIAPMVLVGALSISGVIDGLMPSWLLWPALIVSGSVVGSRFGGTSVRYLWQSVKAGLGGIALAIGLMALVALLVSEVAGFPFLQVFLAYAPGGFDAMPVLALSLGLDPAFVAAHQLMRFLVLNLTIPFLFPLPDRTSDSI